MPPTCQDFNAKARQSTAGARKKGKMKRRKFEKQSEDDPNTEIIIPKNKKEGESAKRERMREEVR